MKHLFISILFLTIMFSCKKEMNGNNDEPQASAKLTTVKDASVLQGEFLYYADAAVFTANAEVYGVIVDKKMHELNALVQKYKKSDMDAVLVQIKGDITPKKADEEGWANTIKITEIVSVLKPKN